MLRYHFFDYDTISITYWRWLRGGQSRFYLFLT